MKKNYTKPEIEMVEYKANDVIMTSGNIDIYAGLDNDTIWLTAWNSGGLNSQL